jgi:UDP-N-acetylglucosamine 2-epimerase (non-hydrolysing)
MRDGLVLCGTRPEAVKLAPLIRALHRRGLRPLLVSTTQHDATLVAEAFTPFGVSVDAHLPAPPANGSLARRAAHLLAECADLVSGYPWVLVHGDTQTAWAGATAAFLNGTPVIHLEAGLRSFDRAQPFPEEVNRQSVSLMADLHLAPTELAAQRLRDEGVRGRIVVAGQTAVDAAFHLLGLSSKPKRAWNFCGQSAHVVVTAHRRENWADGVTAVAEGVRKLVQTHANGVNVTVVLHPNVVVADRVRAVLCDVQGVTLVPPLPYAAFLPMLAAADLVITDSGGLQEECASLGTPFLVCREVTERPEAIESGCGLLAGTPHADTIAFLAQSILLDSERWNRMANAPNPFGDGNASSRCADAIVEQFAPRF